MNKTKMKKSVLILTHLFVIAAMVLCFLKYAEEVADAKVKIYSLIKEPKQQEEQKEFGEAKNNPPITHTGKEWYQTRRLVYHAAGGVDSLSYSNSKEAMEITLANGGRVIEIDFSHTSDDQLACVHEWEDITTSKDPMSMQDFKNMKIYGRYTPMTADDVIGYMREYPDLYIVIDYKKNDLSHAVENLIELCMQDPEVLERFIIQLYEPGEKEEILALYPFPDENFLFTAYKFGPERYDEILEVCYDEGIRVVTVAFEEWNQETMDMYLSKGFVIFEHTINRLDEVERAFHRGTHGIYTDFLAEEDMSLWKN